MTYHQDLGADSFAGYCSTNNPQPGCSAVSGVCKPMNADVLALFQQTQEAINQLLGKRGLALIAVDGRIGPATVAGLAKVQTVAAGTVCDNVARNLGTVLTSLQNQVTREGAQNMPKRPQIQISPPTVASAGGGIVNPPDDIIERTKGGGVLQIFADVGGKVGLDPMTAKVAGGGLVVLGGLMLWKKLRGRAAVAPTTNPSRRRRRHRRSRRR